MSYTKLVAELRATPSRSKRRLLDEAAAAIEALTAQKQATEEGVTPDVNGGAESGN